MNTLQTNHLNSCCYDHSVESRIIGSMKKGKRKMITGCESIFLFLKSKFGKRISLMIDLTLMISLALVVLFR